jgi:hypothetical protein
MEALSSATQNLNINEAPQAQLSEPSFLGAFIVPERLYREKREVAILHEIEQVSRDDFKTLSENF